jgi:hypothetical protein
MEWFFFLLTITNCNSSTSNVGDSFLTSSPEFVGITFAVKSSILHPQAKTFENIFPPPMANFRPIWSRWLQPCGRKKVFTETCNAPEQLRRIINCYNKNWHLIF